MKSTSSPGSSPVHSDRAQHVSHLTRQPIFIVGHPRSGTTLLRAILSSHPQIHIANEPDLFVGMRSAGYQIDHQFTADDRRSLLAHLHSIRSSNRYLESLDGNLLDTFLKIKGETSFRDTFESLMTHPEEKKYWGSKSLLKGYFIRELLSLYPHAIFIPIVRDPRAALLSTYRKRLEHSSNCIPEFGRANIAFFSYEAMRWEATMDAIRQQMLEVDAGSVHLVRFESIVTHPEAELHALCEAIGIDYDPEMLNESRRQNDPVLQSEEAYAHQNLGKSIDPSRAGCGEALPEWASYLVKYFAGQAARREGYDFSAHPTLIQRGIMFAGLIRHGAKMRLRLSDELSHIRGHRLP